MILGHPSANLDDDIKRQTALKQRQKAQDLIEANQLRLQAEPVNSMQPTPIKSSRGLVLDAYNELKQKRNKSAMQSSSKKSQHKTPNSV